MAKSYLIHILFRYVHKHRVLLVLTLILAAISQIAYLLDTFIIKEIIDKYAVKLLRSYNREISIIQFFSSGVASIAFKAVGVAFLGRIARILQDYFVNKICHLVGFELYTDSFNHLLNIPYKFFEAYQSGGVLDKLQNAKDNVERMLRLSIETIFATIVSFSFVAWYINYLYWPVLPILLIIILITSYVSLIMSRKIKAIQHDIFKNSNSLTGSINESIRNIELVKGLGLVDQEIKRLNSISRKWIDLEVIKFKRIRSLAFVQGTLANIVRNIIILLLVFLVAKGTISVGDFFTLFMYSYAIFYPLQNVGNYINVYRETEAALIGIKDILDIPVEKKPNLTFRYDRVKQISFKSVSFQYDSLESFSLSEISFNVRQGETIAFVGTSGSGKSTIMKLLTGLYAPTFGEVTYNNSSILEIDFDDFREQIGLVTQDTYLFAGTIAENLRFVAPCATNAQCIKVMHQASADNLLRRTGHGLDTVIGEGGVKLSGGEKQRLSIARALLREPSVLLFDEATSSLDSISEQKINQTLKKISAYKQHIMILISHRLSTVIHADIIYVVDNGRIVDQGPHQDLLIRKGLYYTMWQQQVGEQKAASRF